MGVLSWCWRGSRRQALRDLRKGLDNAQKAEARDDGPTGPATSTSPKGEIAETVRSAPGRDPRMARFIRILAALARLTGQETFGLDLFVCISYKQEIGGKNGPQVRSDSSGNARRRSQARRPRDPDRRSPDALGPPRRRQPPVQGAGPCRDLDLGHRGSCGRVSEPDHL